MHVQVMEARNLNLPGGNAGPFAAIDASALVSLETEAGVVTVRTPAERQHLKQPKWQHDLSFPDAALSHSLTFAVCCHRRLSSSVIIGLVRAPSAGRQPCINSFHMWHPCRCHVRLLGTVL
jgi:hypothetical protein